jgi:hypothetical protein
MYRKRSEDKSLYSIHNPHSDVGKRDWSNLSYIRAVSIDPGRTNLCIRVEDRPLRAPGPIKTLLYQRLSFSKSKETIEETIFTDISSYLLSISDYLLPAHLVVIERQLQENYPLVRISQHLISWFIEHLRDGPGMALIIEVSGKVKVNAYGMTSLNKPALKKWSAETVPGIFERRGDNYSLSVINSSKKRDDLGDVVLQLEAICELLGLYCDK